jgi:hypothetical protein
MVVANATGCSSIWGGSAPSNPYTVRTNSIHSSYILHFVPCMYTLHLLSSWPRSCSTWASSLFEDLLCCLDADDSLAVVTGVIICR